MSNIEEWAWRVDGEYEEGFWRWNGDGSGWSRDEALASGRAEFPDRPIYLVRCERNYIPPVHAYDADAIIDGINDEGPEENADDMIVSEGDPVIGGGTEERNPNKHLPDLAARMTTVLREWAEAHNIQRNAIRLIGEEEKVGP